jgi:hypothetical protein
LSYSLTSFGALVLGLLPIGLLAVSKSIDFMLLGSTT